MAANYNRPKPVDPIWYRRNCYLRMACNCGRRVVVQVGEFADTHQVPANLLLHDLVQRLRCSSCGDRPAADVTRYAKGN
ncbi:hypothetical protein XEUV354_21725 [Xanthomonas euvesicatoria]|uniref:Uncharacterized protein n=1 Tax=Xanthomonas perforans TaxID=442694 RepID=A0A6P0FNM7_XANPE|nr:hypothetical protein [Xanthomonas euvesicatoria]NEK64621.1 hypothetical protein [Xanthomonas perforans]KHL58042.1 hypothetical protein XEU66b_18245 [Xanthomonas euvesicatoria]KLA49759.1 hypothetical protein XEUV683_20990 [Xanthomonas euvesicatoria]KLA51614.1 hypothetical protein XEUV684_22155 [Xanthomonas euvesicatoria]KLA54786.1 hypothetical protein XEUV685_14535 [Xanthomonas euvesicatoria]